MKKKPGIKKLIRNAPFMISGAAFAVLNITLFTNHPIMACVFGGIILIVSLFLDNLFSFWKRNISFLSFSMSACLIAVFGYSFYKHNVDGTINNSPWFSAAVSAVLSVIAIYFLSTVILAVYSVVNLDEGVQDTPQSDCNRNTTVSGRQLIVIFVTAITAISICSKSSPLYPLNDWGDANCYMTIGKSMLHGLVPYRDLYDHKGPLLYMLHTLAAFISEESFIGVYFLEVAAAFFFLSLSFKTMQLYQKSTSILSVPILAAIVYSADSFCHGDSAEELCLPLLAFAIYLAVRLIRKEKNLTWLECIAVGITSSLVLWIKFSMLGLYIGWFCVIVWQLARHKEKKKLVPIIFNIIIGITITTVPILIYFGINGALLDLWTVYFYNNLFSYSNGSNHFLIATLAHNLIAGVRNILTANLTVGSLIGIGMLALLKKKDKTEFYSLLLMGMSTFLLVYIGGQRFTYYALVFSVFAPFGIISVWQTLTKLLPTEHQKLLISDTVYRFRYGAIILGCLIFTLTICDNTYLLKYNKSDLPQYQFAEIILQKEDATLLNYGFLDGGFYTAAGIIPNCKFFCKPNIELSEIMETQNQFVERGMTDFIVTCNQKFEFKEYTCIANTTFYYEGFYREYFLYQLNMPPF